MSKPTMIEAFDKIEATIFSCLTASHVLSASNMIPIFKKNYEFEEDYKPSFKDLCATIDMQLIHIGEEFTIKFV